MDTTTSPQVQLFLEVLSDLAKESEAITQRDKLIACFCERVIPLLQTHPLIESLRNRWLEKRTTLNFEIRQAEQDTLDECTSSFRKIEGALPDLIPSPNKTIKQQVVFINKILSGKERYCSPPLYVVICDEIKTLLHSLIEAGYLELCQKFAEIDVREVSVQLDPQATGYWTAWETEETEGTTVIYDEKQIEHLSEEVKRNLSHIGPKRRWITVPYIKMFTFSPSLAKTFSIHQDAHPECTQNAAVVWWYFESALFLWNLPSSHFNRPVSKLKRKTTCANYFRDLQTLPTWRELHGKKNSTHEVEQPIIFTSTLFRQGFKTLITELKAYLSSNLPSQSHDETVTFELMLDTGDQIEGNDVDLASNHLWITVSIGDSARKYYYLKRFNDDSGPFEFATTLLQKYAKGGDIEVNLNNPSDSIPKSIERIGLRKEVKNLFFGRSRSNKVLFKGSKVSFIRKSLKNFDLITKSIEAIHQKNGSPLFRLS